MCKQMQNVEQNVRRSGSVNRHKVLKQFEQISVEHVKSRTLKQFGLRSADNSDDGSRTEQDNDVEELLNHVLTDRALSKRVVRDLRANQNPYHVTSELDAIFNAARSNHIPATRIQLLCSTGC